MSLANPDGVLGFTCDLEATGTELTYVLAGTDAAAFVLSAATVAVTKVEAAAAVENPDMTIAQVADSTTASDMALTGLCPAIGQGWMFFMPAAEEGEEAEGLGMTKEEVLALVASVDAMGDSDAADASDF